MLGIIDFDLIILLLLSSIVLAVFLGWISLKIAPRIGLMDLPGSAGHKIHQTPIPLTGGLVIINSILIILFLTNIGGSKYMIPILSSAITIFIFGLLDDFMHLSPIKKMIGQVIGSVILI